MSKIKTPDEWLKDHYRLKTNVIYNTVNEIGRTIYHEALLVEEVMEVYHQYAMGEKIKELEKLIEPGPEQYNQGVIDAIEILKQ